MHRTQLYIDEDIFSKVKMSAKSLNISISEFIRLAIKNELQKDTRQDMASFFDSLEPLESFKQVDSTTYVDDLRAKSRLIK